MQEGHKDGEGPNTRRCTLAPSTQPLQLENEENRYTHNFKGEFCRCGRLYDPETETEAMIHCISCEVSYNDKHKRSKTSINQQDWFHESCLDLRIGDRQPEGDEDDDETRVLIPSDSYDGLICAACVDSSDLCRSRAGTRGWMIIEQSSEGPVVIGRDTEGVADVTTTGPQVESNLKREREVEDLSSVKRTKTDAESSTGPDSKSADGLNADQSRTKVPVNTPKPQQQAQVKDRQSKRDVFLAHGIREQLQTELDVRLPSVSPQRCS